MLFLFNAASFSKMVPLRWVLMVNGMRLECCAKSKVYSALALVAMSTPSGSQRSAWSHSQATPQSTKDPFFSVCLAYIDYYVEHGIPMVRIFGATPAGQKACVHVRGVYPYFFTKLPADVDSGAYISSLERRCEMFLRENSGPSSFHGSKVRSCSLVLGLPFYGYHDKEVPFVKITLSSPDDVRPLAFALHRGEITGASTQTYESHIGYIMQFMADFNLAGMSMVHFSRVTFRGPLPEDFTLDLKVRVGGGSPQKEKKSHPNDHLYGMQETFLRILLELLVSPLMSKALLIVSDTGGLLTRILNGTARAH